MTIEVDNKQRKTGDNKRPITIQGNRGGSAITMGQDTSSINVALFGANQTGGAAVVYNTDLQAGQNDSLPCFTSDISHKGKDKRIRVKGYFTKYC